MKIYGYGKCSTCKKSSKYLDNKKVKYDFHDMVEKGMSQKIVKEIEKLVGDIELMINKSSAAYRELKLKNKWAKMSKAEKIKTLANNPKLIKRPIVVKGKQVLVGFDQKLFKSVLVDGKKAPAVKKATTKKVAAKKTTKKSTAKKTTAKKAAAKKATTKKPVAKKATKKTTAKKPATKKATAKKATAKKTAAKKPVAKKTTTKKTTAKKTAAKKPVAKKATKKSTAKKTTKRSKK